MVRWWGIGVRSQKVSDHDPLGSVCTGRQDQPAEPAGGVVEATDARPGGSESILLGALMPGLQLNTKHGFFMLNCSFTLTKSDTKIFKPYRGASFIITLEYHPLSHNQISVGSSGPAPVYAIDFNSLSISLGLLSAASLILPPP